MADRQTLDVPVGARVLRFPTRDSAELDAAKRIVSAFSASGAIEVASYVLTIAGMKLCARLPPLLAHALHDAARHLRDAAKLAALFESDRTEYDRRDAEYRTAPSADAVAALASRPAHGDDCEVFDA